MNAVRRMGLAAALGVAIGPTLGEAQEFEWSGALDRGDVIEIRGIVGDVRAVRASGRVVEVEARVDGRSRDVELIDFDVVEREGHVIVCSLYPTRRGGHTPCDGHGDSSMRDIEVSIEFTVRVPDGVRFVGRTVSGNVAANGLDAPVEATTVSGDIDISTSDIAEGTTVSGDIRVEMGRGSWSGELEFSTVSGDVVLVFSEDLGADVEFSAVTGEIESDFPISMREGRFRPNQMRGTVGSGGGRMRVSTVTGDLVLRRG